MSILDIAQQRNGKLRDGYSVNKAGASMEETRVEYGTAQGDSSNGFVEIIVDNSDESFEVACDSPISNGDRVAYISTNGNGKAVSVSTLSTIASDASAIANATNQYFWSDTNGIHVSTDPNQAAGTRNILINSVGILLRKAANRLVKLAAGAVEFYDGEGNTASNLMAKIGSDGIEFHTKDPDNPTRTYGTFTISPTGEMSSVGQKNGFWYQTHIASTDIDLTDNESRTFVVGAGAFEYDNGYPVLYTDQNNYGSVYYRDRSGMGTNVGLPLFTVITFQHTTPSISNTSGSSGWLTIKGVPTGYTAIGIVGVDSNHGYAWVSRTHKLDIANGKIAYTYTNTSSTNQKCTFTFYLLCVPSVNVG